MASTDIDQIKALVKRLDDLCREASKIREELPAPHATSHRGQILVPCRHSRGLTIFWNPYLRRSIAGDEVTAELSLGR